MASSGLLASMTAPSLIVRLRETAITSLPPSLLLPVPRSTYLTLDVGNSKLPTLAGPLLTALDSRKNRLTVLGLESNPIKCDCNSMLFQRWLLNHPSTLSVHCHSPVELEGQALQELPESELICGVRSTKAPPTTSTTTTRRTTTTFEPEIIWSVAPTTAKPRMRDPEPTPRSVKSAGVGSIANDDTLIIGIVGGVVAFILLLIIIICIARCRMSSNSRYQGGPLAAPPMMQMPASCTCVKPPAPSSIYMSSSPYSAKGYPPGSQPYYISYPPEEVNMQNMHQHQNMHMDMHYADNASGVHREM